MINLDTKIKVSTVKIMVSLIFEIDSNGRDIEIDLIKVLLQLGMVRFKIRYFKTVIFFFVFCLVGVVTKEQYP